MKKGLVIVLLALTAMPAVAQRVLTLDSCRVMALRNNKQMNMGGLKKEIALNTRKAARTKYLPKVSALGGYEYFSREVSLLSGSQKSQLNNLGTTAAQHMGSSLTDLVTGLTQQGVLTMEQAQQIGSLMEQGSTPIAEAGNSIGKQITDAFHTNTHNMWAGAVMVRQPLYMGGALKAANRMADIGESLADNDVQRVEQSTLYDIDQAYWTVVSLKHKQRLAYSYRDLVKKLDDDVHKMIREGVATRADGLKVDVAVNSADMQITQVEDGVALSKMLLCQLCGLDLKSDITLADEDGEQIGEDQTIDMNTETALNNRPELKMLQNTVDLSREATRLIRAEYLPHVFATGGYMISNPNVFDGFRRRFAGTWNVGVTVHIPVWSWMEGAYKIRASKAATNIAELETADMREKMELQVEQSRFKLKEAHKKLAMANRNMASAEENLRCANIGFSEGVMNATDVMEAQTAWQQAQSQKIDAEVDVRLSQVGLRKALGILSEE